MRRTIHIRPARRARQTGAPAMQITIHAGAHRSASTSFQQYMRQNTRGLGRRGIGFWGPLRTRAGLFDGLMAPGDAGVDGACRRIAAALERARDAGVGHLVVSDENLLGSPTGNLRARALYPECAARMARVARAFAGHPVRIALSLRRQDGYWPSAMAYAVGRGLLPPGTRDLDAVAGSHRRWQDVIRDVAAATPGAAVIAMDHDLAPPEKLSHMTGQDCTALRDHADHHLNAAPDRAELRRVLAGRDIDPETIPAGDGPWQPFDPDQSAMLREAWQDDLFWLSAGADGIARYHTHNDRAAPARGFRPDSAGRHLPPGLLGRGHPHGIEERRLVGSR